MKIHSNILTSAAFFSTFVSSMAWASAYPPGYCDLTVRTRSEGPVLLAHAGGGCSSHEILGYRANGMLAQGNPEFIEAVVTISCQTADNFTGSFNKVVKLGREWNGNGYMSEAFTLNYNSGFSYCTSRSVSVAFVANGVWDSKFGQNYDFNMYPSTESNIKTFQTKAVGSSASLNTRAWEILVEELKN
jgi:hypothetical protein